VCELQGKKWVVEYQEGNKEIAIEASMKQNVYVFKCIDCLIKVDGKVNAIVLDSCSKTACIFDEAMASIEIVNSKDIQIQCIKSAPAMSIDGCTAVTYYMSSSFAESQIITAKSAAVNLIRPTDDDDIVETPIPEQFCTVWKDGNWVTEAVSHDD
jgi:adenylyl cyclase-associated protein